MSKEKLFALVETEEEVLLLDQVETEATRQIVLFNDNVNTFDFVIETLVKYCEHDPIQAEQCTLLVHFTGKCSVKRGTYEQLKPICSSMLELGLTAEIQ